MSEPDKPDADFSETEAIETDDEGRPRIAMERLTKGGLEEETESDQ